MAKALLGHVGTVADYRLASEVRRLQLRVKELEAELAHVRVEHAVDEAAAATAEFLTLNEPEPAYT